MLVGFVDAEGIRTFAERAIQVSGNAQAAKTWPQVRDALGLQGLRQVTFVSGFSGKGWEDNLFIAAPPPRKGLLALLDAKPISDDALRLSPRSARIANAASFDLSRLLAEVRNVAGELDPNVRRQIDEALQQASGQLGLDIERDLIGALGHEWVSYTSPTVGGNGLLGMVAVNRLRDAAKAQQTLTKLVAIANRVLEEQLKGEEVTVKLNTVQIDGMDVTYLGTPFVSPAWGVRNGNLFVALYPQNVVAAARAATAAPAQAPAGGARAMAPAGAGEGSILDNPDFVAMRQALPGRQGAASISAIQFMDLRLTAPDAYPTWLAISRVAGFGDLFGVQSPPMLLPPLSVLAQHLGPAAGAAWGDDAGWHYRSYSPFPGSTILANDPLATYVSTIGPGSISVLLPSLNRAREQANRIKSANNLRQIGFGVQLYANDHNGKFPKDLAEIYRTQDLEPAAFVNPRGQSTLPAGLTKENAGPVNEIGDYVYVGAGLDSRAGQDVVVAYENPERNRDGVNVLYGDGHVDWVPMEQAREQIEKAKSRAGGGGGGAGGL
jgi:prepilin-type processing-associated H-X9-DG protein